MSPRISHVYNSNTYISNECIALLHSYLSVPALLKSVVRYPAQLRRALHDVVGWLGGYSSALH